MADAAYKPPLHLQPVIKNFKYSQRSLTFFRKFIKKSYLSSMSSKYEFKRCRLCNSKFFEYFRKKMKVGIHQLNICHGYPTF